MSKYHTFPSGLRLYFERKTCTKSIAVGVFVGVGSSNEDDKTSGLAHMLEHLNFKGTTTRSAFDIANEMDNKGIQINAFTSKSYTCYYTVGMAKYAEDCVEMLSDIVQNSTYTEENINKEKGVIIEEINMYEDDGEDLCYEKMNKIFYGKAPYARPILGSIDNIKSFCRQDVVDFVKRWYAPKNTVISIVGNLKKEEVIALVERYFESNFISSDFSYDTLKKFRTYSKEIYTTKPNEQANVCIRFPSYNLRHKRDYAPFLVGYMLGGGMSSRLFQKVREQMGLVYSISSSPTHYYNNGFFDIGFATSPCQVGEAIVAIREVVLEIKEKGFAVEEHQKAVAQFMTSLIMGEESAADCMRIAGRSIIQLDKVITFKKCQKALEKITTEDIKEAVDKIFDFDKCCVSYVGQNANKGLLELFKKGKEQ